MPPPWLVPPVRFLCLPVSRCETCGDELVAGLAEPVCWRCRQAAILRRRLAHRHAGGERKPVRRETSE